MTEFELSNYIRANFPKENESCDWKSYRNLKQMVAGKEGEDFATYVSAFANMDGGSLVVGIHDGNFTVDGIQDFANYTKESAKYKLLTACTNLKSEGFDISEYITDDTQKMVWIIHIPKHAPRKPVYAHGKAWQRHGDSCVVIWQDRLDAIIHEIVVDEDWSAELIDNATLDDLDSMAIAKARVEFAKRNADRLEEVKTWDDVTFLNKAKLTQRGKITRTALILLGKEESEFLLSPYVAKIRWELKTAANENKDYAIYGMPLILAVDKVFGKIRNTRYTYMQYGSLFPEEMLRYDPFNIREALNNCIAHQDYTQAARIEVTEFENDHLIFRNYGSFLPGSVEDVVQKDCPESIYRNRFLVEAMRNLNMIETEGGGIRKMFGNQRRRLFPMPDYDFSNGMVRVDITGKVIDENFAKILANVSDLTLSDIIMLDKVQKHKTLTDDEITYLRKQKYIEGRKPNFYLSYNVVEPTGNNDLRIQYIKNRNFDDAHYKDMIIEYIRKYKKVKKAEITKLIIDKLSPVLSEKQKAAKVQNLLSTLRMDGKIAFEDKYWTLKK